MSGRGLARLSPLAAPLALVLAATLTACGGSDDADTPSSPQGATSDASPDTSPDTSTDASTDASTDGDSVAVTVTRKGDAFTPNGERVELGVDQTLVLTIEADEAGEMHVHSTPEQEIAYDAGSSDHELVIDRPGVVEVESHDPDVVVLQLEVR